jgi:hypothetical protein
MTFWDDITNAVGEIDNRIAEAYVGYVRGKKATEDYIGNIGKAIGSSVLGYVDEKTIQPIIKESVGKKKYKELKNKGTLNTLGKDWYNESARSKELTFNVLDTPVNFTLNNYSSSMIASNLRQNNPQKYIGQEGWAKALREAQDLAFGEREGLSWYEQDPERVAFGEAWLGLNTNAPLAQPLEQRQQYWADKDQLDSVMWTTLGAMIIFDPFNWVSGGGSGISKLNKFDDAVDVINYTNKVDDVQNAEALAKVLEHPEVASRLRHEALTATVENPANLFIRGTENYQSLVTRLTPHFSFWTDLPEDIQKTVPQGLGFKYATDGKTTWGTSGGEIFEWIPEFKGQRLNPKTKEYEYAELPGTWKVVNILPKYQERFLQEIAQAPTSRLVDDVESDVSFFNTSAGDTRDLWISDLAEPVQDTSLLHIPIFSNEYVTGTKFQKKLGPTLRQPTIETATPAGAAKLSLDPTDTKFIEVTVADAKSATGTRRLQLAISDGQVYHLDTYQAVRKSKPPVNKYTDEKVDELFAKGIDKIRGDKARAAIATNLFNRITPEDYKKLTELEQEFIAKYSDPKYASKIQDEEQLAASVEDLNARLTHEFDPDTGELVNTGEVDENVAQSLSDYYYNGLDDVIDPAYADEFSSNSIDDVIQEMGFVTDPSAKVEKTTTYKSYPSKVWVLDSNFKWSLVKEYSGSYINPITGIRTRYTLPKDYIISNAQEVFSGGVPRIYKRGQKGLGEFTFDGNGAIISMPELNKLRTSYHEARVKQSAITAEAQRIAEKNYLEYVAKEEARVTALKAAGKTDDPVWTLERQIKDEMRLEDLKNNDPYEYANIMESTYGVPRNVSFKFKINENQPGRVEISFIRTTQETSGYGDNVSYIGDAIEETVHTWDISKKEFNYINNVIYNNGGTSASSKMFRQRILGEKSVVGKDDLGNDIIEYGDPVNISHKDLGSFGEPRWRSHTPDMSGFKQPTDLKAIEDEINQINHSIALAESSLKKLAEGKFPESKIASTRAGLEAMKDRRIALIKEHTEEAVANRSLTELNKIQWQENALDPETLTRTLFTAARPDPAEVALQRWINGLNKVTGSDVSITSNLPEFSYELDAARKSAIAKSTEALKAEMPNAIEKNPFRPESILEEALSLSPKNQKIKTLLDNFKSKNIGPEENDFLDAMLAAVSVGPDGSKLSEEDLTGFETLISALTGETDAARILDKQKEDLYKIVDKEEALRQESIRSENKKFRLEFPNKISDNADESQVPIIHSTKHSVVRNKDGSVSLFPAGHHVAGTSGEYPRASVHFTLETPVVTNNGGTWSSDEIRIVSDLSSMIKDNKLPHTLRSDDTWWQINPGKPIKISNAIIIRPVKNADEKLPVIFVDKKTKDITYQIKKNYTEKDRKEILKLAEGANLVSIKVDDITVNLMNSESFAGYERDVLDVLSLQLAKKELGINTAPQTLGGWGLNNKDLEKNISFLQEKHNISSQIHRGSTIEHLEKSPELPSTKFYGGIEAMRYAALMGKFKAMEKFPSLGI